jgi:hypothetical protein
MSILAKTVHFIVGQAPESTGFPSLNYREFGPTIVSTAHLTIERKRVKGIDKFNPEDTCVDSRP